MSWSIAIDERPMPQAEKAAWRMAELACGELGSAAPVGFAEGVLHTARIQRMLAAMGFPCASIDLTPSDVSYTAAAIAERMGHLQHVTKFDRRDAMVALIFFDTAAKFNRSVSGGL